MHAETINRFCNRLLGAVQHSGHDFAVVFLELPDLTDQAETDVQTQSVELLEMMINTDAFSEDPKATVIEARHQVLRMLAISGEFSEAEADQ